jgi:two-component system chemotaxis response regulator CheY
MGILRFRPSISHGLGPLSRVPRILVMEDDDALRGLLTRVLRSAGHEVVEAENGVVGLRLWREHGADLVLTDIHMPETNGIEVMLELRAFAPTLPVIAMSGGQRALDLDLLGSAKLLGAVKILTKPFSPGDVIAAVAAALKQD